ncbi:MAG: hypothetical protein HY506_00715 [Candidatus Yanofskybacteria bacterium]|nr:hypothetical protein [Candidatus Yanofskybacteria bacterium]
MNLLAFNRNRKKAFLWLSAIFYGAPLLGICLGIIDSFFGNRMLGGLVFLPIITFILPVYLIGTPSPFLETGAGFSQILPTPTPLGLVFDILFWLFFALLISWPFYFFDRKS